MMSKLWYLVFMYIGLFSSCLDVHFHHMTFKNMLESCLQVKKCVLCEKHGFGLTYTCFGSTQTEGNFKRILLPCLDRHIMLFDSTQSSDWSTHNLLGLNPTNALQTKTTLPCLDRLSCCLGRPLCCLGQLPLILGETIML